MKAQLCRTGCQSLVDFCRKYEIEHEVCGKVIVATEEREMPLLDALYQRGLENGIPVLKLSADQVREIEPQIQADDLVPTHAGVRAQALRSDGGLVDDFLIIHRQHSVHVCNAPSPAATSSLEIGRAIAHSAVPEAIPY